MLPAIRKPAMRIDPVEGSKSGTRMSSQCCRRMMATSLLSDSSCSLFVCFSVRLRALHRAQMWLESVTSLRWQSSDTYRLGGNCSATSAGITAARWNSSTRLSFSLCLTLPCQQHWRCCSACATCAAGRSLSVGALSWSMSSDRPVLPPPGAERREGSPSPPGATAWYDRNAELRCPPSVGVPPGRTSARSAASSSSSSASFTLGFKPRFFPGTTGFFAGCLWASLLPGLPAALGAATGRGLPRGSSCGSPAAAALLTLMLLREVC
mmetsp:Transcript_45829/g.115905  ORF Transcript_45829/g.115905 Transcript_45829/m.115905 type:complete len:266 (+) Transcript_45829:284-1081(+)